MRKIIMLEVKALRKKVNVLLLNMLTIFSITAHANDPNRIEFDISNKDLPANFEAIVAFIYETSGSYTPGVVRIKEAPGNHHQQPFSIKTESKFISVTHAEVTFNGSLHQKYQINSNCANMRVLDGDSTQFIFFNIDLRNRELSCSATD
jgi:hypothetical protein